MEEAATRPHHPVREEGDKEGEDVLLLLPALELDGAVLHGVELEAGVARDALLPAHHPLLLTVHGADPHHALQHHSQPAGRSKYFICTVLHMQTEGFVTLPSPDGCQVVAMATSWRVEINEPDVRTLEHTPPEVA